MNLSRDSVMIKIFLIFILFIFLHVISGAGRAEETITGPRMTIKVFYDRTNGSLNGSARVTCTKDTVIRLPNGSIRSIGKRQCMEGVTFPISVTIGDIKGNITLFEDWHPSFDGLGVYELTVELPKGITAVSEADEVVKGEGGHPGYSTYAFRFPHPREGVSLVMGKYVHDSEKRDGITVETYFFREHAGLAKNYIEKAFEFIEMFQKRLGTYPFKRFQIVENEMPTGLGMATMTLVGKAILGYPFMVEQSLGHEIAHSWFGNCIYVDYSQGNWSEGLTTYVADYAFKVAQNKGAEYRHDVLIDYDSYVHSDDFMNLREFRARTNRATKAVGYGKAMMFFHMLENYIGEEAFSQFLRRLPMEFAFKKTGWDDLKWLLEAVSQKDLDHMFQEWLERRDLPRILLEPPIIKHTGSGTYSVEFDLVQKTKKPYWLKVPLTIKTTGGDKEKWIELKKTSQHFTLKTTSTPLELAIDPKMHIARHLLPYEFPPTISRLIGDEALFFVVEKGKEDIWRKPIRILEEMGFKKVRSEKLTKQMAHSGAYLFLGTPPPDWRKALKTGLKAPKGGACLKVVENPFTPKKVIAILIADVPESAAVLLRKMPHYGRYNYLEIKGRQIVKKEKVKGKMGIVQKISLPTMGISAKDLHDLSRILDEIQENDVICIGEQHDQFSHHMAQLDVISGLFQRGFRIAVGMEMFQRPFQHVLDQYINGTITEREFLKQSQYFSRWGYDYVLYRPILRFCRENKIPVIALNIKKEISTKVASKGLDALDDEEKKLVPPSMDLSNEAYKKRLKEIFEAHPENVLTDFDHFFQAQVLWDETMAQEAARFIQSNPGTKMVILAGIGHIGFGYGIPDRIRRRTNKKVVTIATTGDVSDPGLADFYLFPPYRAKPFSARLGVIIDTTPGMPLSIKKVMPGSPAARAGLEPGDIILKADGEKVTQIADLKITLLEKRPEDTCQLTIKRIRRFRRDLVKTLVVGPFSASLGMFHSHGSFHKR